MVARKEGLEFRGGVTDAVAVELEDVGGVGRAGTGGGRQKQGRWRGGGRAGGGGDGAGRTDPAVEASRDTGKSRAPLVHPEGARGVEDRNARPRDIAPAHSTGKVRAWVGVDTTDEQEAQEQLEGGEGHERATEAAPTESGAGPSATTDPRQKPEFSQRLATLAGMLPAVWP